MSTNTRIAKNTIYMYIRMFIIMGISLYTSRVFLKTLGVEDFGIYNLVGGVVVLFSFLNNAMTAATQRYLNVEVASDIIWKIQKVFSMSMNIHVVIALIVLVLFETAGLWILNYQLNIPAERMAAANIIFQFSIVTALLEIMKVPYNALLLAKERISFYAVMGVIETILRLFIVLSLFLFVQNLDKLMLYSLLMFLVGLLSTAVLMFFCRRKFEDAVRYRYEKDIPLFKNLLSFSGWSMMGQVSKVSATQGVNMLLNNFFGVGINAAIGVAGQLNGAIYSFVSNAQIAFNPQIVQSYARHDIAGHVKLVLQSSRFSFFILAVICIPFLAGTTYVLHLWLGDQVPDYSEGFTRIIILGSMISAICTPLWMSAYAVGNIKMYQIILSILLISILPISYLLLKLGYNPYIILISKFFLDLLITVFRFCYFKKTLQVEWTHLFDYFKRIIPLAVVIVLFSIWTITGQSSSFWDIARYTATVEACVVLYIVYFGMKRGEVDMLVSFAKKKIAGLR